VDPDAREEDKGKDIDPSFLFFSVEFQLPKSIAVVEEKAKTKEKKKRKKKMTVMMNFLPLLFHGDFVVGVDVDIDVETEADFDIEESKEGENVGDERSKNWKYFHLLPFFSFSLPFFPLLSQKKEREKKKRERERRKKEEIEGQGQIHDATTLKGEKKRKRGRRKGRQKEISSHIQDQTSERRRKDTYDGIEEIEESERMKGKR